PFYAKTAGFTPYDEHFLALCRWSTQQHFALFALTAAPLTGIALRALDRENEFLLAGTAVFSGYHALLGVDVMGMRAGFFAPALARLAPAAARGLAAPRPQGRALRFAPWLLWLLGCALFWAWTPQGLDERVATSLVVAHWLAAA